MKKHLKIIFILLLIVSGRGFSQTPEQRKMIDKALKMQDSIMKCITIEEMLQQANAQEKRIELANETNKTETKPISKVIKSEDKYWKNTLASNSNSKLIDWNNGNADVVFNYHYDIRKDKIEYLKIGVIKEDGSIELNPLGEVPILEPINEFKNTNKFFDIHNTDSYKYSNEKSGIKFNSYLLVYQNDAQIGVLTISNSVKVSLNLLTPGDLYFGDEGYLLSWVYAEKASSIMANENWKGDLSNTGTPLLVETNVSYDLNFKPGWNLVKTEVIGTYEFPDAPEEDKSRYKKHEHTIVNSIPEDATYFFRKTPQY